MFWTQVRNVAYMLMIVLFIDPYIARVTKWPFRKT